ncbi:hypothetical protein QM797_05270 [Rhodococcus sp. IEGM 1381]|uniref:hypothetical protein n=1 Tax=Rhodococcus sp. IEGM 1381 TaxID=3047085 RepID=UPI0024B82BE5|nr:hypothetical protein [Rhodococcus sp. IEGM 1381]MDI9894129.1 hypothetical protein [Rhodococcus sp. IEGM 1381]
MSIALGVHVGVEEVSAVLVEADLPELGPISTRTVSVAAAPGGVGDAVTTMLGIMRVQAAQNDLHIVGSAVVCDSIALCGIVRAALAAHDVRDVGVVDAGDPRLDAEVPFAVAAALFGTATGPAAWRGELSADGLEAGEDVGSPFVRDRTDTPRSARLTMIGLGVAVLAALSGATVWALAATGPEQSPAVDTADAIVVAETPSSATVVADSTGAPLDSSSVPSVDPRAVEAPPFGPVPVGAWSEPPPAGLVPTPVAEAASGTGGSGGGGSADGGRPDRVIVGGGGNSPFDDEAGGGQTPTKDPKPEPEPEPEIPDTDPPTTTVEVPVTTEPTSTPEEPAAEPTVDRSEDAVPL